MNNERYFLLQGITGHEFCHYFWDPSIRMEWEGMIDSCDVVEWLSSDTLVTYQVISHTHIMVCSHCQTLNTDKETNTNGLYRLCRGVHTPQTTTHIPIGFCANVSLLSGYHADTPITIKAEAIHKADSQCH